MNIEIHDSIKAQKFTNIFQHIKLFTDCINITFDKNQIYVQAMDSSHIVIFEIYLPRAWFCNYSFPEGETSYVLGLNASVLYKILNTRDKSQQISIEYSENKSDKLFIHFSHSDPTIFDKHFELPLMDIESDVLGIPEFTSNIIIKMPSSNFASIVNTMQIFGDTLQFQCEEDKMKIVSNTTETGNMAVDIDNEALESYSLEDDEPLNVSFALYKMHDICMFSKIAEEIEIFLTSNYPIKINYDIGQDAKLVFYLAPKICEE